jgi:hypothetical protein
MDFMSPTRKLHREFFYVALNASSFGWNAFLSNHGNLHIPSFLTCFNAGGYQKMRFLSMVKRKKRPKLGVFYVFSI